MPAKLFETRFARVTVLDLGVLAMLALMTFATDAIDLFHIAYLLLVVEAFLMSHWGFWPRVAVVLLVTELLIVRAGNPVWNDLAEPAVLASIAGIVFLMHCSRDRTRMVLREQATKDPLTGLLNRRALQDQMDEAVKDLHRDGVRFAVIYVDLDGFKSVNDAYGHDTGDVVLSEAARRIESLARKDGRVGRIGGDEFAVLLRFVDERGEVEQVADRLLAELETPFMVGVLSIALSASMGIAMAERANRRTPLELLSEADRAMYSVKRSTKGSYAFAT